MSRRIVAALLAGLCTSALCCAGDHGPALGRTPEAAVKFTDDENGVAILVLAGGGKSNLLALHTSDGGQTWEHHDVPTELGAIYLSHDGAYLTVTEPGKGTTVFER